MLNNRATSFRKNYLVASRLRRLLYQVFPFLQVIALRTPSHVNYRNFSRLLPSFYSHFFKKFILTDSTNKESGYVSNETREDLVGQIAVTATALRPSGTIVFGDERIDVVSEGAFIDKDEQVKIVKAEGSRIVVRKV